MVSFWKKIFFLSFTSSQENDCKRNHQKRMARLIRLLTKRKLLPRKSKRKKKCINYPRSDGSKQKPVHSWRDFLLQRLGLRVFFIIKGFWTIVFIFIVISTMFRPIRPLAFFRCLSNSGTYTELRITSFIESTRVTCSDSVSHNRVEVLSIPLLFLTCC